MLIFKIYLVLVLLSIPIFLGVILITEHLVGMSKSNKFKKWWNNNIVDLDNKYKE